ncbi:hypothetical protein Tco_0359295, partial [Tanacetum coccineum]
DLLMIVEKQLVLEMLVDESLEMIVDESLDMIEDEALDMIVDDSLMVEDKSLEKLVDETLKLDEEHIKSVIVYYMAYWRYDIFKLMNMAYWRYGIFKLMNMAYWLLFTECLYLLRALSFHFQQEEKMVNARHKEVLKSLTFEIAECSASDAKHGNSDDGSSSSSEDLNLRGFMEEETKALSSMISNKVGKAVRNAMPYHINQTTYNIKEVIQKELEEYKREGIMKDFRNEMVTYRDFMACDVPKFNGILDPNAST